MTTNQTLLAATAAMIALGAAVTAVAEPPRAVAAPSTVITAREAGSGMATGRRQHQPVLIRKDWSSRAAADSDCARLGGSVSPDNERLVCAVEPAAEENAAAACARIAARLSGARCVAPAPGKTAAHDDWSK